MNARVRADKALEPHFHVISQRASAYAGFIERARAKGIRVRFRPARKFGRMIYDFNRDGTFLTVTIDPLRATRLSLSGMGARARAIADDLVTLGVLVPD